MSVLGCLGMEGCQRPRPHDNHAVADFNDEPTRTLEEVIASVEKLKEHYHGKLV